ncbi:PREDICTED: longitudinals lacking protein, isoforms H/M/V-like isoform X3 [Diuraphis noxia]|uniref:longitudinals lacking protein, isoforms H/M/V-like isoform X3 n=1 Tax=Diuraphis noxia TaxID=143948 RepID=UPI00076358AC|nr:PREDICTED: longitudinals lacking protein, isoforms H/M/V-like isoform X3 [Diuraphis noxia]
MAGDNQHFCLRWNNHQSTLISVFDTLLESGTLVDCTLAAEGQYLKAHKVVLSACSPYLELLLSQHYEKHPIVILKDVKFQELKSMMDYMYRGEVNISQDQLSTFLKAAESLQIKGLTDGGGNEDSTASPAPVKAPVATPVRKPIQQSVTRGPTTVAQGLTIERRPESPHIRSRDDSASPTRKRRRNQRRPSTSDDPDSHIDTSNSCDVPPLQSGALSGVGVPNIPATITKGAPLDDGDHETDNSRINNHDASAAEGVAGPKIEPTGELIEPKTENLEDYNNEDSIEDLTLDDDDDMDNSMDMLRAGPSHDNSNQSFNQWPMSGNQTTDEVFMNAQEAVGAHRDTQELRITTKPSLDTVPVLSPSTIPQVPEPNNQESVKCSVTETKTENCYRCKNCKNIILGPNAENLYVEHIMTCLDANNFECSICFKKFAHKRGLTNHLRLTHLVFD